MSESFLGKAIPLDPLGVANAVRMVDADPVRLWAVMGVETAGCGFQADRRPKVLFERHVFSAQTGGRFDATHPYLSNQVAGGYEFGGPNQYARLQKAIALDRAAALRSTSWGLGQVLGKNAEAAGFADVQSMIEAMAQAENAQLEGMVRFVVSERLDRALRAGDWERFARGYNGKDYWKHGYQDLLAREEARLECDGLPDLRLRAAQAYLTFLGFDPRGVDGRMGDHTRSAMNRFQYEHQLPITRDLDAATYEALQMALRASDAGAA